MDVFRPEAANQPLGLRIQLRGGAAVTSVTAPALYPFRCPFRLWGATKNPTKEDTVNVNLGSADRKLRAFVVAPVFVVAGVLVGPASVPAIVLYALAGVMVGTAAAGACPLYMLFGLRTCPMQKVTAAAKERIAAR